ncbi:MAG: FkbM family methyltransferase, partial [Mycobacterium sp.]
MSVARSARRWLAPAAKNLAPQLFWRRKYRILQRLGESRPDVRLVASLCDRNRVSLDIGADVGEFTIAMLPWSQLVVAFEP